MTISKNGFNFDVLLKETDGTIYTKVGEQTVRSYIDPKGLRFSSHISVGKHRINGLQLEKDQEQKIKEAQKGLRKELAEKKETQLWKEFDGFIKTTYNTHSLGGSFTRDHLPKPVREMLEQMSIADLKEYQTEFSFDDEFHHKIELTFDQLKEAYEQMLDQKKIKKQAHQEKEEKTADELQEKIAEAMTTDKKIVLDRRSESCTDRNIDCNIDIIITYAYPDGSIGEERHHTY